MRGGWKHKRLLVLMAVVALIAAACSAGDDDASSATADEDGTSAQSSDAEENFATEEEASDDAASETADAEREFVDEAVEEATAEAFGGVEAEATEAPASEEAASADEEAAADDGEDSGLFSVEQAPEPDPARQQDNFFRDYGVRGFVETDDDPLSTFALDVDTGSYTVLRRFLQENTLPPRDAVRVEEWVNAFDYRYDDPDEALGISVDGGPSPFDDDNYLLRIGVQGERVEDDERRPAALTFVVDTSGSMDRDDRLELVKDSLAILVDELDADDTVAVVTYDNSSGVVLPPTPIEEARVIYDAIDSLRPGGSTNLEAGLETGYSLAREAFRDGGINRVVLASDGVANVGIVDPESLSSLIRDDADAGIQLVTVGFGLGNFNDTLMEQLADRGDGFYAYVDTEDEAERLFEDELTSTLVTVAKDAKIQVEFDDDIVDEYRLIGFENRGVLDQDFRDDRVDAGEIGAGHQVTALYELDLRRGVDLDDGDDVGEVRLRWQDPDSDDVTEIDEDLRLRDIEPTWGDTSETFQLATVVATFAELLRDSPFADEVAIRDLADEVDRLARDMERAEVDELADLVAQATSLS